MSRRRLLLIAVTVLAGLAALLLLLRPRGATIVEGPIVLISIDTLRADRLPAYGYGATHTPHIDRLASDGVVFDNAYAHSPQTLPSHISILSGLLPFEHGARDNVGFTARDGQRFVQHALGESGFATGGFVSSYVLRRQTGMHAGFDTYDDRLPPSSPEDPLGQVQRGGAETVAQAIRWIEARRSPKFFLFAHIYEPHAPYTPPARFAAADPYDGEVSFSDEIVGALLEHLRERGLYDRATIVLLSDHGEGLGDHGEEEHGIFLYRETIRVPLIVKLPASNGGARGGRVVTPVQHIDLVPTLLELTGLSELSRGRSLVPLLTGAGTVADVPIYSESLSPRYHFGWSELYALSDDRYRFIRAPRDELYDLARDPHERTSVAGERGQVRSAMRSALDTLVAGADITSPSAISAADRQKLAALGYVGTQSAASVSTPADQLPDPKDKIAVLRKYRQASRLAGRGQLREAIELFRELLEQNTAMTDVRLRLADAYMRVDRPEDAFAAYRAIIERDPTNAAGLTGAAGSLMRAGRIDEARAHAELAAGVAPAIAHELLARIAVFQDRPDDARRSAELARKADPTLPMPQFVEGLILHRRGEFGRALPHFMEALRMLEARTEQIADLNYFAADSLARLERYAEAEPLFRQELDLSPGHLQARAGLAMLYAATGRDAEAGGEIDNLLRHTSSREAYAMAARLWTMFGRHEKAAEARAAAARGGR